MHRNLVGSSFALMFLAAYLDNVRGPLLPVLGRLLHLPYATASWLFVAGNLAAVALTFSLLPLSRRFGERALAAAACVLGLSIPWLALGVSGLASFLLLAAVLGATIAVFGTLSNILLIRGTDFAQRARFFCGLHMLYGFGSLVAPAMVAWLLARHGGAGETAVWSRPLWVPVPAVALLLGFFTLRFRLPRAADGEREAASRLGGAEWLAIALMCAYVIGETLITTWMVAFLVDGRGLSLERAAPYLSGFFLAMGGTRAVCFLRLSAARESAALWLALGTSAAAVALGHAGWLWALPFAGFCGPFFPVMMARISRAFPEQSRSLTIRILAAVQLSLGVAQVLMGWLADRAGVAVAYRAPIAVLAVVAVGVWRWRRWETRRGEPMAVATAA